MPPKHKKELAALVVALVVCASTLGVMAIYPALERNGDGAMHYRRPVSRNYGSIELFQNAPDWNSTLCRFSSFEEMKGYIEQRTARYDSLSAPSSSWGFPGLSQGQSGAASESALPASSEGGGTSAPGHSETNIQVAGVDEGDIVKNDGRYAYIVSGWGRHLSIVDAYPASGARILSTIDSNGTFDEIYVVGESLVAIESLYRAEEYETSLYGRYYYMAEQYTVVSVFDIGDRSRPALVSEDEVSGFFSTSRLIGDYLYLVTNTDTYGIRNESELPVPADETYYVNGSDEHGTLTNFFSLRISGGEAPRMLSILMGSTNCVYVSACNIYIAQTDWGGVQESGASPGGASTIGNNHARESTVIHRLAIGNGSISYSAAGDVPGTVLNRFSMDEHGGHFRVATTKGWYESNQLYVMDMAMDVVGGIEGIAPGERIYSARFMGERAYIVTFKKVDPLFVVDLSNPSHPAIAGELKIPGYSDYLHPYDENHVIGIGKDAEEQAGSGWALYQGVKIALFDVTNMSAPAEIDHVIIGERGTDSLALREPHAFLFDREKNLLVVPIDYVGGSGSGSDRYGSEYWNGAFVYNLTVEGGFQLNGIVKHSNGAENGYYYGYDQGVRRSFYIGETLYTCSDRTLKANDMQSLAEMRSVELPGASGGQYYGGTEEPMPTPRP